MDYVLQNSSHNLRWEQCLKKWPAFYLVAVKKEANLKQV